MIQDVIKTINHFLEQVNVPISTLQDPSKLNEVDVCNQIQSKVESLILTLQECLKENAKEDYVGSDLIQITASKDELDKRIAAFIAHSQQAIDEQNVQEFCQNSLITSRPTQPVDSCARTDVLYKRRPANITHMQVSRVTNEEGPQTNVNNQGHWVPRVKSEHIRPQHSYKQADCPPGLTERLDNLHTHLKINHETAPKDVYGRLQEMEKRVLKLESISPEYFSPPDCKIKREKGRSRSHSLEDSPSSELNDIDDRIRYLKRKLLKKS